MKRINGHSRERCLEDLIELRSWQHCHLSAVARHHCFERLHVGQLRPRLDYRGNTIQAVDDLAVHWLLYPCRTILVEARDPLRRRDEMPARRTRRDVNEVQNGLLCRAIVPGGQRILPLCE